MRLQLISDLHLELHADHGRAFLRGLRPMPGAEVLVVAGDLTTARAARALGPDFHFGPLVAAWPEVVYVPGNREHYGGSPMETEGMLDAWEAAHPRLTILRNDARTVLGRKFYGGTMWFKEDPAAAPYRHATGVFHAVSEQWIYRQEAAFREGLLGHGEGAIVVSHHLPVPACVSPRFRGSPLNAFFLNDVREEIMKVRPALWLHGHTHDRVRLVDSGIRIFANPVGRPGEDLLLPYDRRLIINA